MAYGLGWAIGPAGQLYLDGRLPGYRAALLVIPDRAHAGVVLSNQEDALRAVASLLGDMRHLLAGGDLTATVDAYAA